jgi:serine/threonine protein kinase
MGIAVLAMLTLTRRVPLPLVTKLGLLFLAVILGHLIASGWAPPQSAASRLLVAFVAPYLLVVLLGYICALGFYRLRKDVRRARNFGSYQLVERLGQGGMGEVWRARHRLLARPAAIKVIRPSLIEKQDDPTSVIRRFEREAQVTAQLQSPHTVELWDYGKGDDGGFYYVMELLDGLDLEALVKRFGPLPADRAIHMLRQVCHSLAEAESKGLVHRDIKPSNIFACRYGGDHDFIKVLDFGIVKATNTSELETGVGDSSALLVHGTPAFIAPEQALGSATVDGRADIYATGCVAYWLLTGHLVFTAETPMGILMHHAHSDPVAPSRRTELAIPAALDDVVMACLAKDPAHRPQTAAELSRRLGSIAAGPGWSEERAREWWTTHRPASTTP